MVWRLQAVCVCFRKLYVVLSVVLCLLASSLVAFFLYPRSMVVVDDGIHAVIVHFDRRNTKVLMNMTVGILHRAQRVSVLPQTEGSYTVLSVTLLSLVSRITTKMIIKSEKTVTPGWPVRNDACQDLM